MHPICAYSVATPFEALLDTAKNVVDCQPRTVPMWLEDQQLLELTMCEENQLVYPTLLFMATLVEYKRPRVHGKL